jgi:RHS repeat-associated protein
MRDQYGDQPPGVRATGKTSGGQGSGSAKLTASASTATSKADEKPSTGLLLPSISVPKGGGALRGIGEKFSTNPATGTGSLSVPLAMSSGRGGFGPGLELGYDSGGGNGPFGLGWSMSTLSVTRKTDKGLPRYEDAAESDTFVLSGAEDLVPVRVADGTGTRLDVFERGDHRVQRYRPRTEGLFARIERWTHRTTTDVHWRVTTRDNVLHIYGRSPLARLADSEAPGRVFSWLLEEKRDDRGNVVRYTYKAEDGAGVDPGRASESNRFATLPYGSRAFRATAQRYLKRIQYGNRTPVRREDPAPASDADWLFEVVFDYGEHDSASPTPAEEVRPWLVRTDAFSINRATFEVRTYRLCRRVLVFHRFAELGPQPCLVRSTDFTYEEGGAVTYLTAVTQAGYKRDAVTGAYERASLPALELSYVRPTVNDTLQSLPPESLEGLPGGVDGASAQWVDLDGEGLPGVLLPEPHAWSYKPNLGEGRLAPPARLRSLPSPAELRGGVQQLTDLEGDGQLDLVQYAPPLSGYFERSEESGWKPFIALNKLPNIDWNDPRLRFVDLDGDGHPDVLVTEQDAFVWYRSRAKEGFAPATRVPKPLDERMGPAVVFTDGTESLHLADMTGDGLADLVRVRNGEVCYWPNVGHGRFGARVTLDQSPRFDAPDQFDPKRIRFADIDGSGTSDLLYLGREGVVLYFNEAGNRLSEPRRLTSLPPVDPVSSLSVVDLLGQGTACLVWSSPLPGNETRPLVYLDLMGGRKPHVLDVVRNNLGGETRITYAPSTKFYLRDKAEGRPWLTRLAFPVQVIERIERHDHVARSKLVTRFRYHHGYFDGYEREFRGFACVEQWDAESFQGGSATDDLPPVLTRTWFHTGAWLERERLEVALSREYYDKDPAAPLLPDTVLPAGLSLDEEREAARALRGHVLRQEVYAEDGTAESVHPYSISERDYEVRLLQSAGDTTNAVFFVHPRQTMSLHYERKPGDARMQHEVVLAVDDFGNVTQSVALAYPRRVPAEPEQARLWATHTRRGFVNRPSEPDWYRVGVPTEVTTSEWTGLVAPAQGLIALDTLSAAVQAPEIPYEARASGPGVQRRVVERERTLYYRDDLTGPLLPGLVESLALPYETYRQAFTPGLVTQVYSTRVPDALLLGEGHYVLQDGVWWSPSGRVVFDTARFYLPIEAVDAFGQRHFVRYDAYALLVLETEDPLRNCMTAGLRDTTGTITRNGNDYRVLAPGLLSDPNRNRTAVEFDALGLVVKTALQGKEGADEGDTLADPTTRLEYDLHRWKTSGRPAFTRTLARKQHGPSNPGWLERYSYSDGSGREVMSKAQAEPGPVPVLDASGRPVRNPDGTVVTRHADRRWVSTGRTVFDNKGNPVKKYEPFFSGTSEYEDEAELVEWGVTPILRYDPLGRLVRTDQPNGTHSRVVFDAWRQERWDENDSVTGTPWLARKQAGTPAERRCASLALAHAGTPTVMHLDALGRVFLTVADNGIEGPRRTRVELDIEGLQRSVTDARGLRAVTQDFDLLGRMMHAVSLDAGESHTFLDVGDKPLCGWAPRGEVLRRRYDAAQRLTHLFVQQPGKAETLVEHTVHGELHPDAAARNLRTRVFRVHDGAGALTSARFDFKGNLLETSRRFATGFREAPDWMPLALLASLPDMETAAAGLLEAESFTLVATYDALGRVTSRTTPDGSETRPTYNEARLLDRVQVRVRGAATWTTLIENIDYNAKGQRERVAYGNGALMRYEYDRETFRLVFQRTTRASDSATLQSLRYEHDPVGNIVAVEDGVSFGNTAVSASGLYEYDALYQLVKAEGREHPGQQPAHEDPLPLPLEHPNDLQALRRYRESYRYDAGGNIERVSHQPLDGAAGWTRLYEYAPDSNRLSRTTAPGDPPGTLSAVYSHDAAGNMSQMPHLPGLDWDHAGRLQSVARQAQGGSTGPNDVYFAYDASGVRARKVYKHGGLIDERLYLGGYEVFRRRSASDGAVQLERQTLHVMDDQRRVALVETKTVDTTSASGLGTPRLHLQLDNHLGSSMLELDEAGQVISYEEYHPYGSTAFQSSRTGVEVSAKRYRYSGKERDEETGLYYHGARYYAAWLGRWTSCDPVAHGTNLYCGIGNNPVNKVDPDGRVPVTPLVSPAPAVPPPPAAAPSPTLLRGLPGGGMGDGIPRGALRLVPQGGPAAAELLVTGGAVVAAAGSLLLLGTTIKAAVEGKETPIDVADKFYGTHFGDIYGWVSGRYSTPATAAKPATPSATQPVSETQPIPVAVPVPKTDKEEEEKELGRIYVTYTKFNKETQQYYSGRTSMVVDLKKPLRPQALLAVELRDANHHVDENDDPKDPAFDPARLDRFDVGTAVNYENRYRDAAYWRIRGREQQLIDSFGGARSDTGKPYRTENAVRGVGKENPRGRQFHDAATAKWGQRHPYTGY